MLMFGIVLFSPPVVQSILTNVSSMSLFTDSGKPVVAPKDDSLQFHLTDILKESTFSVASSSIASTLKPLPLDTATANLKLSQGYYYHPSKTLSPYEPYHSLGTYQAISKHQRTQHLQLVKKARSHTRALAVSALPHKLLGFVLHLYLCKALATH